MIRVQYARVSERDPIPTWVDGSVRAVPAESFAEVDQGQGGITRGDIVDDAMISSLDTFLPGAEVYVESDDATDCLDDETPEAEKSSHIWWRATIVEK